MLAAVAVMVWWRDKAECRSAPLDLVDAAFARPGGPAAKKFIATYCKFCPVWRECLDEAMETGEAGIWGGTSDHARSLHGGANYRQAKPDPSRLRRTG